MKYTLRNTFSTVTHHQDTIISYSEAYHDNHDFEAFDDAWALRYAESLQEKHDTKYLRLPPEPATLEAFNDAPCYVAALFRVVGDDLIKIEP